MRSSTWNALGKRSTLYISGREWLGAAALYRVPFLSFPIQWADAIDTLDDYIVGTVFVLEQAMLCQLTLAPRSLGWSELVH